MAASMNGTYWDKAITPVAFSLRMKTTTATSNRAVAGQCNVSSNTQGWTLILNNTANKLTFYGRDASADRVLTANSVTVNDGAWHTVAVNINFANGGTNTLWVDGTSSSTNATGAWGGTANGFTFGKSPDTFWSTYNGELAEVAAYSAQLTNDEVAALNAGFSAPRVAMQKLSLYMPMIRSFTDIFGGTSLHNSGGETVTDHPRVVY